MELPEQSAPRWYFPKSPSMTGAEVGTMPGPLVVVTPPDGVDAQPVRGFLYAWMRPADGAYWWAQVEARDSAGRIGLIPGEWVRPWEETDGSPVDDLRVP